MEDETKCGQQLSSILDSVQFACGENEGRHLHETFLFPYRNVCEYTSSMSRGQVWVIGGPTGIGKTTMACDIAFSLSEKHPDSKILYLTGECSSSMICRRLLSRAGEFPFEYLLSDAQSSGFEDEGLEHLQQGADPLVKKRNIKVKTVHEFMSVRFSFTDEMGALPIGKQSRFDVVILDSLQSLNTNLGGESYSAALAEEMRQIKQWALEYGVLFIVVSQALNDRISSDFVPQLSLKSLVGGESVGIHADGVLLLSNSSDDERILQAQVAKCRCGRKGTTELFFQPEYQRFREIIRTE